LEGLEDSWLSSPLLLGQLVGLDKSAFGCLGLPVISVPDQKQCPGGES
jgi:hypothetical protein